MSGVRRSGQRHGGGPASAAAGGTAAVYSDGAQGGKPAPNGTQSSTGGKGRGPSKDTPESGQALKSATASSQNTKGSIGAPRKGATKGPTETLLPPGPASPRKGVPAPKAPLSKHVLYVRLLRDLLAHPWEATEGEEWGELERRGPVWFECVLAVHLLLYLGTHVSSIHGSAATSVDPLLLLFLCLVLTRRLALCLCFRVGRRSPGLAAGAPSAGGAKKGAGGSHQKHHHHHCHNHHTHNHTHNSSTSPSPSPSPNPNPSPSPSPSHSHHHHHSHSHVHGHQNQQGPHQAPGFPWAAILLGLLYVAFTTFIGVAFSNRYTLQQRLILFAPPIGYALVSTALQLRLRLQRECARAIAAVDHLRGVPGVHASLSPSSSFKDPSRSQHQQQQQGGAGGAPGHAAGVPPNGHSQSQASVVPALGSVFSPASAFPAPSSGASRGVDLPRGSKEGGKEKGRDKQGRGSGRGGQSPSASAAHPFAVERDSRDREGAPAAASRRGPPSVLPALFSPAPAAPAPAAGHAGGPLWASSSQGGDSSSWKGSKQRQGQGGSGPSSPTRAGAGGGGGGGSGHRGGSEKGGGLGGGSERWGALAGVSDSELLWMSQTMEDWPLTFFLVLALESAAGAFWIGAIPPSCTLLPGEDTMSDASFPWMLTGTCFLGTLLLLLAKDGFVSRRSIIQDVSARLGCWHLVRLPRSQKLAQSVAPWAAESSPYGEGAVVRRNGRLFVSLAPVNWSAPGSTTVSLLYILGRMPFTVGNWILAGQFGLAGALLVLCVLSWHWEVHAVLVLISLHAVHLCLFFRQLCSDSNGRK